MFKLIVVTLSLALSSQIWAASYTLDSSHAKIGFKIRHLGISNVSGRFQKFTGTATYDEKTGKLSNLIVEIDAASIYTNEPDRDKHLKAEDFFNVKKYPKITFKSTKVEHKGKTPTKITGKLKILKTERTVTLDIVDWGGTATDPWGNAKLAFEARGIIDRTKYGLTWNKGLKGAAGLLVGNDVKLVIEVEANKI